MADSVVVDLLKEVPALAVLTYLVHRFLKAGAARDAAFVAALADATSSIRENTKALGAVEQALETTHEDSSKTRALLRRMEEAA